MLGERPEIHLIEPTNKLPNETLVEKITTKAEKSRGYNLADFNNILASWYLEAGQEKNPEVKTANLELLNTVKSLVNYAVASKWEGGQSCDRWQNINKLKAARAGTHSMFMADDLSKNHDLLNKFWQKIFLPLTMAGGENETNVKAWQIGFMAELAVGKAFDKIFMMLKNKNLKVFKGLPPEDVKQGYDLVVASTEKNTPEWPLQIKTQRGGYEAFVQWFEAKYTNEPTTINLVYRQDIDELFNLPSGQPTNLLIQELGRQIGPQLKRAKLVN